MNRNILFGSALAALCVSLTVPAGQSARAAEAADAVSASTVSRLPVNLARASIGTHLEVREPKAKVKEKSTIAENRSALALISDDAALTYPLEVGRTSLILSLSKIQVLSQANFINFGAQGRVTVSVSSTKLGFDAPGWKQAGTATAFSGSAVVSTELGSADARYVKIDFDTEVAGRISGLGVFGLPTIGSYQKKPLGYAPVNDFTPDSAGTYSSEARIFYFDLANLQTGARVVALSRGQNLDEAQSMLDGNADSNFAFDPADPAPAVVVDLGVRRTLNRLSCVYEAPPGRLDFYLVDNPYPKKESTARIGYVDSPTVEPVANTESGEYSGRSGNAGRQAIYSVDTTTQPGLNRLAAELAGQKGRFLVAEFHPIAAKGDFKDFKDAGSDYKDQPDFKDTPNTAIPAQPLRILSLSVFGQAPTTEVVPQLPVPGNNPGTPGGNPTGPIFPAPEPIVEVTH